MRRTLVLALAIAVTAAFSTSDYQLDDSRSRWADSSSISETIFRPGNEYTYSYESKLLTGIPAVSTEVGGIKIRASVKLQFHRSNQVVMKMEDVSVYAINDAVRSSPWRQSDDFEESMIGMPKRIDDEQERKIVHELGKPCTFSYDDGEVRHVQTTHGDKFWSTNIKKGVVSMLQVKLTSRSSLSWSDSDSSSSPLSFRGVKSRMPGVFGSRRRTSPRMDDTFDVMETDVNGECETKYVVNSERSSDLTSVSQMTVTKVKNFDKCLGENTFDQGLFAHLPHLKSDKKLIQPSYEAEYWLSGDRHNFLIKKVDVKSKYSFTPYQEQSDNEKITTHVSQKLRLQSARPIRNQIEVEQTVSERNGLKMQMPRSTSWTSERQQQQREREEEGWGWGYSGRYNNDDDYDEMNSNNDQTQWNQLIDTLLNNLLASIDPIVTETSSGQLIKVQHAIRQTPSRQLYSIIKSYAADQSDNRKCEILLDILPTSINKNTGKVLIDLVRDGTIRGIRAPLSISAMVLTVKPSPQIVKSLLSLYEQSSSSSSEQLSAVRQAAILGAGTLCNKMINHMRRMNKPIPELIGAVEEVAQELRSKLDECQSEKEKILIIKAMGNMGAKEIISPIKSICDDRTQPTLVRVEAVFALRKLAKSSGKTVKPLLVSMALNKRESTRVRISAFTVLKQSMPSFSTLQLLSHCLHDESNHQVKTFVYTTLVSLANDRSNVPEFHRLKLDARKVLKLTRSIPVGTLDSKSITSSTYSEQLGIGGAVNVDTIKSRRSGLPVKVVGALFSTIFGNSLDVARAGAEGEMVNALLRRLVGPHGLLKQLVKNPQMASMDTILGFLRQERPQQEHFEMTTHWRDLFNKKSYEPITDEDAEGVVFGQIFDYDMYYRPVNGQDIEKITQKVIERLPGLIHKLKEGISLNTLKTLSLTSNSLVMPTPAGIPLSLNVSANAIVKLDGLVRARSLPSIADFMRRRPFLNKNIELETQIKPSWSVKMIGYMGIDMELFRTAMGIKSNVAGYLPIKADISVDPSQSKLTIRVEPPTETVEMIKAKVEPVKFMISAPSSVDGQTYQISMKTLKPTSTIRTHRFQKVHDSELSEFQWAVKSQWSSCGQYQNYCPKMPFTGKQSIELAIKSLSSSPKEFFFTVKKFTQDWYNEEQPTGGYGSSRYDDRELENGFTDVEKDEIISSPRKAELYVEAGVNGFRSSNSKAVKGKITWITENNYLEHQINAQFIGPEIDSFKLELNSIIRSPFSINFNDDYFQLPPHIVQSNDLIGKLEAHWGRGNFRDNSVRCKLYKLDKTKWNEQLAAEGCSEYGVETTYGHGSVQYGLEAEFPQLTHSGHKYLAKVLDAVKRQFYHHLRVNVHESIPQNKIVVLGQYNAKTEKMSLVVKSPRETDLIVDVPVRCPWMRQYGSRMLDLPPSYTYGNSTYGNLLTGGESFDFEDDDRDDADFMTTYKNYKPSLNGECKIHKDKMLSFDGTPILLPVHSGELDTSSSRCDVLLARDCRPESRSSFAVTGSMKHGKWSVKVLVPQYAVELVPEKTGHHHAEVKVNGEQMSVDYSHPLKLHRSSSDETSGESITVIKIGNGLKAKLHELGVSVTISGHNKVSIKVSATSGLQGRLCGLCGNNNYDLSDDMTSSMGDKLSNGRQFVLDNVLPSDYCNVNDYETLVNNRHSDYCLSKKTATFEKTIRGEPMKCFSKEAIKSCRPGCSAETLRSVAVKFFCVPIDSQAAERLTGKLQSGIGDLTSEISGRSGMDESEEIEMPTACSSGKF